MPADWHTRDEVLSSETTASEKPGSIDKQVSLRLLFHSRNYSQFVKRSSKPDNVAFEKKLQWAAIIWSGVPFQIREEKKIDKIYRGKLISPAKTFGHQRSIVSIQHAYVWMCIVWMHPDMTNKGDGLCWIKKNSKVQQEEEWQCLTRVWSENSPSGPQLHLSTRYRPLSRLEKVI